MEVFVGEAANVLLVRRWHGAAQTAAASHFGESAASVLLPIPAGDWGKLLDSSDSRWDGPGSGVPETVRSEGRVVLALGPRAFVLLARKRNEAS